MIYLHIIQAIVPVAHHHPAQTFFGASTFLLVAGFGVENKGPCGVVKDTCAGAGEGEGVEIPNKGSCFDVGGPTLNISDGLRRANEGRQRKVEKASHMYMTGMLPRLGGDKCG